jgi:hypothetical protein
MSMRWSPLSLCALVCACTAFRAHEGAAPDGMLPRPYTAAEIQAANPPGTTRVYLISEAGEPTVLQTGRFLPDDEGLARFENLVTDLEGRPVKERSEARATWEDLQAHANFPSADTTLRPASCTVAAGVVHGILYERTEPPEAPGGAPVVHRFWFDEDQPGPPALYEMVRGEELLYRMELVELRGAPR